MIPLVSIVITQHECFFFVPATEAAMSVPIVCLVVLVVSVSVGVVTADSDRASLVTASGKFALNLYGRLARATDGGNVFFSPFSISSALAMTYGGARGDTRTQMADVLGFNAVQDGQLHPLFRDLFDVLISSDANYTLSLANRLFSRQGTPLLSAFRALTADYYNASIEEVDFAGAAETVRLYINQWVENQTNSRIQDLLPRGSVGSSTVLVLVNAIYFKALWDIPFDPDDTASQPFYVSDSETVDMDMMTLGRREFNYHLYPDWNCQLVELPYDGNRASMVLLVPNERTGIATLESELTMESLEQALAALSPTELDLVSMPRFRLTQSASLKAYLSALGMSDLFDPGLADLSGIRGDRGLVVTEVLHKAFIEVTEEGTEAAAATAVIITESAAAESRQVVADRPFLFLIRDVETGTILFLGKLARPAGDTRDVGQFGADEETVGKASAGPLGTWLTVALACMLYAANSHWLA